MASLNLRKQDRVAMNKILFYILLFFVCLDCYGKEVAGIELHKYFTHTAAFNSRINERIEFFSVVDMPFGKWKIPYLFVLKFSYFYLYMKAGDEEWPLSMFSLIDDAYDYTNVYADNSLPGKADIYLKYFNIRIPFNGVPDILLSEISSSSLKIASISSLKADTMHFQRICFNFKNVSINSSEDAAVLSSVTDNYPTNTFINDYPTSVTVRVIAPNNPHYPEYRDYLNAINTNTNNYLINNFTNINWDDYATEISLEAGEKVFLPDENNFYDIDVSLNGDEDGDTITNEDELFLYGTDPKNTDTDGDGLQDNVEVAEQTILLQFPSGNIATNIYTMPSWHDTDGDGISDGEEVLAQYPYVKDGITNYYVTNPISSDTDDDGLTDDVDPYPLNPCNNQDATQIDAGWADYWLDIAQKSGISIFDLTNPYADSDGDGISNIDEMKNKSNPIFTNGFRKVIFEPSEIHFAFDGDEIYTNSFYLNVFSSDVLTGAVFMSNIDWKPLLDMYGLSVLWSDCPIDQTCSEIVTFSCQHYKKFKFSILLRSDKMNSGVRNQNIEVVDTQGIFAEKLTLIWDTDNGSAVNEAPSRPILLEPINGNEIILEYPDITDTFREYENVHFVWTASNDPEGATVSYTFNIYDSSDDKVYTASNICDTNFCISTEEFPFERGYYYWNIIASDGTCARESKLESFFIRIPGDEDGDGIDDNDEIKKGYSPYDSSDFPLDIVTAENLEQGNVGREYFCRLKAKGGKGKIYSWQSFDEDNFPPGLHLETNGEIRGVPTSEGTFNFDVSVCDGQDIVSKKFILIISEKRDGLILRLGKGLIRLR